MVGLGKEKPGDPGASVHGPRRESWRGMGGSARREGRLGVLDRGREKCIHGQGCNSSSLSSPGQAPEHAFPQTVLPQAWDLGLPGTAARPAGRSCPHCQRYQRATLTCRTPEGCRGRNKLWLSVLKCRQCCRCLWMMPRDSGPQINLVLIFPPVEGALARCLSIFFK